MSSAIPSTPPTATILHISDLHLGINQTDTGNSSRGTALSTLKHGSPKMQAHDPYIFATLPLNIQTAAAHVHASLSGCDLNIVTGDISTNVSPKERFDFAKSYLCGTVPISPTFSTGLQFPKGQLYCIPGNHDKLNQLDLANYNNTFGQSPATTPYRSNAMVAHSKQQFVIYAIDSNLYEDGNIAVGRINPETLAWLHNEFEEVKKCFESAPIRILILHHHPVDLNKFRRGSVMKYIKHWGRFTELKERELLLAICKDNIDIILHGHEHFPVAFTHDDSDCVVVSAGTASQWQKNQKVPNSFHILSFHDLNLKIVQFDWQRALFKPVRTWQCNLAEHPRRLN